MIARRQIKDVTVLELKGNLDHKEVVDLKNIIDSLMDDGRIKLVLGLEEVRKVDFLSLCVLVDTKRELMARHGDLRLAALSSVLAEYFKTVGARERFTIFQDIQEAARSFRQ